MEIGLARRQIVRICRKLDARALLSATHGNVSMRLSDGNILLTPAGLAKADIDTYDLLVMDLEGKVLEGELRPNSDIPMHLEIYKRLPDVMAVIRAYPPHATGFACANEGFENITFPAELKKMGYVDLPDYGEIPIAERAAKVGEAAMSYDVMWTGKNGALTFGKSLDEAYFKMESMELFAQIELSARAARGCGCKGKKKAQAAQKDDLYDSVRSAVMKELEKYQK